MNEHLRTWNKCESELNARGNVLSSRFMVLEGRGILFCAL